MGFRNEKIYNLFLRYLFIVVMGFSLSIFYKILTPLTLKTLNLIFSINYEPIIIENMIRLPTFIIEIIPACVAGAAFYLLIILIFSIRDISPLTRIKVLTLSFILLFAMNILRILVLVSLTGSTYFDTIHWVFWNLVSTIFVVAIWLGVIKIYKINSIPIYSDAKYLLGLVNSRKDAKRSE